MNEVFSEVSTLLGNVGYESLVLLALAPIFYVCIALEWRYLRRRAREMGPNVRADYTLADTVSNMTLAAMHQIADGLSWLVLLGVYYAVYQFAPWHFETTALTVFALVIGQDFFYYWFHRVSHRVRWFWASHVTHHSSEKLNLSTAFRQSLTYPVSGMWLFWLPLAALGFEPKLIVLVVGINLGYQFFVHTQAVKKLPAWFEYVFNTPSHHRAHHARNDRYIDQNFGGVLIIWDRLFGTFTEETDEDPCDYGIVRQVRTHNPVTLTFHEWGYMLKQAFSANLTLGERLRYVFGPPEWEAQVAVEAAVEGAAQPSAGDSSRISNPTPNNAPAE